MEALFLKLVNLSLTASWLILVVLLLRQIFCKAPKWIFCLLWGMVAIRLICPISIESALSLIPSSEPLPEDIIYTAAPAIQSGVPAIDNVVNPILSETMTADGLTSANPTQVWSFIFSHIWLIGLIGMLVYALGSYLLLKMRVDTATIFRDNIKQSEQVDSPFVLGFFRPVIYIPYNIKEKDLEYVIAHEEAHIRRKDHYWKPIGFVLLSVYWFNPLLWAAYIFLCRDIEAACDEKVIKEMEKDDRRAYSTALLNCSVHRRRIAACPLAFGEVGVKDRVKSVMNYKKPAFWIVVLAVIAAAAAGICLLTNPLTKNTMLMGAEYEVEEVLYAVTVGNEKSTEPPSAYCVTPDYHLYQQQEEGAGWSYLGALQPYDLTKQELNSYMSVEAMRKNANVAEITDAYILHMEYDNFYLVFQTKNGDTYLAYGWGETAQQGGDVSDGTRLRRLYLLDNRFEENTFYSGYFTHSMFRTIGENVDIFEYRVSDDFPGYAIIGFLSRGTNQSDMRDMGYAVFQMSEDNGYRMLQYHVYPDAAVSENGIYYCEHPAVMDVSGVLKTDKTYDVILSCNSELAEIKRIYKFSGDENDNSTDKTHMVTVDSQYSMTLFSWELEEDAAAVSQILLDKDGNEILASQIKEADIGNVGKALTLEDVVALSQKGMDLTWKDFEHYSYYSTGSGLYIRVYEIDDTFSLMIGGSGTEASPMYIYLTVDNITNDHIDIRTEDVETFIKKYENNPLNEAIIKAIINENKRENAADLYHCASFVMLGTEEKSGTPVEGSVNHMKQVTVYGWALYSPFQMEENAFSDAGGGHFPVALTFHIVDGGYKLAEYWEPRDGSLYVKDIRDKLPDEIEEEALNNGKYILRQMQECYEQAIRYGDLYAGYMIEDLLDIITSSPALSSNPADYVAEHSVEYRELTYLGAYTLEYCYYRFLEGNGTDLKGHIMARACEEIANGWGEALLIDGRDPETGQEWFEIFKGNAENLARQFSDEEIKQKYPASWLLLHILEGYY